MTQLTASKDRTLYRIDTLLVLVTICLAVFACGGGGGGSSGNSEENFAEGLVSFEYLLIPGLGFCPLAGDVHRAQVLVGNDGSLSVSGAVIEQGERGRDDCFTGVNSGACFVDRKLPVRTLSAAERQQVLDTMRTVRVETESLPGCDSDDPCRVQRFVWTNDTASGETHTELFDGSCAPRLAEQDVQDITSLIASLMQ